MNMFSDWCALFDWDGVVIDSSKLHEKSWEWMSMEYGLPLPDGHFRRGFGMKNERIIPEVLGWASERDQVADLASKKERRYRELVVEEGLQPLPGVAEWIVQLHDAGVPISIASSTDRANIDCVLEQIGLGKYFNAIVSGDEVEHGKPAPDIFLKAASKLGGLPALVFEDALVGIEAAHRANMAVVAVTTTHPVHELTAANFVVERLDQLTIQQARKLAMAGCPG
ncbi:MAG TPA: HAD family phosphatase [Kiritimatiellia bacterium]|nr:HAD family phosphatase [Kiritimatiellia bacterium]